MRNSAVEFVFDRDGCTGAAAIETAKNLKKLGLIIKFVVKDSDIVQFVAGSDAEAVDKLYKDLKSENEW